MTLPPTRGHCVHGPRPCPHQACRYHLAERGRLYGTESCALDVADRGGATLEAIGDALGLTRERVRQIEEEALTASRRSMEKLERDRHDWREVSLALVLRALEGAREPTPQERWRAQTAEQQQRTRERVAARRATETPEERARRLEYLREYCRKRRAERKGSEAEE